MASKLQEITTRYRTFVDNQVLTKDQLNEFVSYFDDQDRLTRVFVNGVGLLCGFTLSRSGTSIVISRGVGITTDGDLLLLKKDVENSPIKKLVSDIQTFTHFSTFTDDLAVYPAFRKLSENGGLTTDVMDLYELHTEETEQSKPLSALDDIDDKVVVLYLESYTDSGDLCTSLDCDNQGLAQLNRLRVLLLSENDAELLAKNDTLYARHNVFTAYSKLPELAVKRVVLSAENTASYASLKEAYNDAITSDDIVNSFTGALDTLVLDFGPLLQLSLSESEVKKVKETLEKLFGFSYGNEPFDIQYRYDFLKDLIDTYAELKGLLLHLTQLCFPEITAFPKHLMLGQLSETGSESQSYRHKFYRSPLCGKAGEEMEKAQNVAQKLFKLIGSYQLVADNIEITPSLLTPECGRRSIPFYYAVDAEFLKLWDYTKTQQLRETYNLGYHKKLLAPDAMVQDPLSYNTDGVDFYRIEGHQGKHYTDVLKELDEKKRDFGLPFDIKVLSISSNFSTINPDDYSCEFEDLTLLLDAWSKEQDCILAQISDFFSGFSTKVPGANLKEAELDLKKASEVELTLNTKLNATTYQPAYLKMASGTATKTLYSEVVKGETLKQNLSLVEDTLGVEMYAAIEENVGGSVNDIIASASQKLALKVDTEAWNAQPELKDFVVNKSVELMAYSYVLTQKMPSGITLVDSDRVSDYKLSLEQLCSRANKLKASYQSASLSAGLQAFTGLLLNQLATVCCSGKKLEVLLEEINARKQQILDRLQLSKFIEQHPGLEHKGGVRPGGTFVIVYKNSATQTTGSGDLFAEASPELQLLNSDALTVTKRLLSEKILNSASLSSAERNTVLKSATELLKYEDLASRLEEIDTSEKYIPLAKVPDNTVVADFALPYMCCADCAPVNFVMAIPPVSLRLSADTYCLLNDTKPVLFEVSPADGDVEMDPDVPGIAVENGKLVISADAFPDEMLGKTIRFTVNKQVTDAQLTVYPGIEADFSVPAEPTSEATHRFVPEGEWDDASFFWEFGDGTSSTEKAPTHTYKLPVNDKNTVQVRLTVTSANGVCQTVCEHPLVFAEVETEIRLKTNVFCENDKTEYPFVVTPSNAKVEIAGDGVSRSSTGYYYFVPAAAKVGELSFLLNGEPSGYTVSVLAAPQAACSAKQVGNQLIIYNTSKNASNFMWTINGSEKQSTTLDPLEIQLTPNSPSAWKISLLASGAGVCSPSRASITVNTQYQEESTGDLCIKETSAAILRDVKLLQGFQPGTNDVLSMVLEQTRSLYGGSSDFNKGVVDQMELFLSGKANSLLEKMFSPAIKTTSELILELANYPELQAEARNLLELQLRLLYNVLACQSDSLISEAANTLTPLFDLIIESLISLQKYQLIFSDTMKLFIEEYAKKISDRVLLSGHIQLIIRQKLI